ncbi:MAG: tetratricopeptide repeat protein [Chitinophagaceae bacterium]|nr:tetratricopeptide repeat protein [Chitinophagaceae bacterium]
MPLTHQLTAILFADIVGYTSLMQEDEEYAIKVREKFERTLKTEIGAHAGRIVQHSGDGALCIFNSAIEAVAAAISIQKLMQAEPTVPLRIGIHSGDIIIEEENVYGDGVNIASRIESFAVAGSVFVSEKIYDEIKNQKNISTVSLGKYQLKHVKTPVEIYAISNHGLIVPEKAVLEGKGKPVSGKRIPMAVLMVTAVGILIALALLFQQKLLFPTKNTTPQLTALAVLPFANLSASKEDEYFTDGMCDEILTQISKIGELNVMSRTSTLQYKGTTKSVRQIADELGADVILEGSVQKSNDKFRINVQLVDAKNDKHLWAESFDRPTTDVFAVQSEIASKIAIALDAALTETEKSLFDVVPTENIQAYDFYLRGNKSIVDFWRYMRSEDGYQAERMYEQAIKLDPEFTAPYQALVDAYVSVYWEKLVINSDDYRVKAKMWLDKLIALKIDDVYTHSALATYKFKGEGDYEGSLAELNIVDQKIGNGKYTYLLRADILRRMGRIDASIGYFKLQAALFPRQARGWAELAETYKLKRNFDSSLYYIDKAIEISPDVPYYYTLKSMYYAELKGDVDKAQAVLDNATVLVDAKYFENDYFYFETLRGKYDSLVAVMAECPDSLGRVWQYSFMPNSLASAMMCRLQGKEVMAKYYFQKAVDITSALLKKFPDDFRLHAALGVALAGIGEKEKAVAEGNLARTMMPVSRDAVLGVSSMEYMALIYTQLGEHDKAIDILEQMLKMPFGWTMSNTIPLYRMHYFWKPLKHNPRFQQLIGESI